MFKDLKKKIQDKFEEMSKQDKLFYVTIDRDLIFEKYLNSFAEEERQGHNCNACKSFLRQYGGIVAIINGKRVSIWDNIDVKNTEYQASIDALSAYIHSLPITDVFYNAFAKCGVDRNLDGKNKEIIWEHFFIVLPKKFVMKEDLIDSAKSEHRATYDVLKRGLEELKSDAFATVLELIAQGSLYRGNEFLPVVSAFGSMKVDYDNLPANERDNYVWSKSLTLPGSVSRIRNTSIGTLLIDLSAGVELDKAVASFERVVAPANYKRPTAVVTARMIDDAKKKLDEMGLTNSLERRHANIADLNAEDVLYIDRSSEIKDVFQEMAGETIVNPKTLSKVEEISIDDFITKIIPGSKSIEVLLEDRHLNNMMSIVTAKNDNAPTLFKWENSFSWAYTGGITDSIKERVKSLGGIVDAVLRFTLQWNEDGKSIVDLDLHAHEPTGDHIYYATYKGANNRTRQSGMLDIDMINPSTVGIENITWSDRSKMKKGAYRMRVINFNGRPNSGFTAQVEFDGQSFEFAYNKQLQGSVDVADIIFDGVSFTIRPMLDASAGNVKSKEKWNVKTNQFTKVRRVMLSPNYWLSTGKMGVGNKHFFFLLENCLSDEETRPFFNEFLKNEFNENRKVFEILGSKMKVPQSERQLSGVGFSDTQRNSLIVRVEGAFKRNLKINF